MGSARQFAAMIKHVGAAFHKEEIAAPGSEWREPVENDPSDFECVDPISAPRQRGDQGPIWRGAN